MNQKIKYVGLLAILPLFTIALSIGYTGEAYAVKSFGTSGQTCGQGPCAGTIGGFNGVIDETKMTPVEGGSFVKLVDTRKASTNSENLYKVTYDVSAGEKDVVDVFILIKSDADKDSATVAGISAEASSITTTLITASDPASITVDVLRWNINS